MEYCPEFTELENQIIAAATAGTCHKIWNTESVKDQIADLNLRGFWQEAADADKALVLAVRRELAVPGLVPHQAHVLEPGAILYASWGWEQTNINFYVVVKVKGEFATVAELEPVKGPETSFMSNKTEPGQTILWEKGTIRRKIKSSGDCTWIGISSYKSASLWEGQSLTESHYA